MMVLYNDHKLSAGQREVGDGLHSLVWPVWVGNVVRALRGMQLCGYKIKPGANSKNMAKVEHIPFWKGLQRVQPSV